MYTNDTPIDAKLTLCRQGQALITLNSEPFNGLEIKPEELIKFAERLVQVSIIASSFSTKSKKFKSTKTQVVPSRINAKGVSVAQSSKVAS